MPNGNRPPGGDHIERLRSRARIVGWAVVGLAVVFLLVVGLRWTHDTVHGACGGTDVRIIAGGTAWCVDSSVIRRTK